MVERPVPPLTCINPITLVTYFLSLDFLARLIAINPITTISSDTTIATIVWVNHMLLISSESLSKNSLVDGSAGVVIGQDYGRSCV